MSSSLRSRRLLNSRSSLIALIPVAAGIEAACPGARAYLGELRVRPGPRGDSGPGDKEIVGASEKKG